MEDNNHNLIVSPVIFSACNYRKSAVPKISRFTAPLVTQHLFYGAPRAKEIPDTSVYSAVRSKHRNDFTISEPCIVIYIYVRVTSKMHTYSY